MSEGPGARDWTEDGIAHIDVRSLPPPRPLIAILQRVHALGPNDQLVVHHDRDPMMLYPELAEIGWEALRISGPPGEVRLLLKAIP